MDPNETNARLLSRDSFHQAKGINKQKKENSCYTILSGTRIRAEHQQKWANSHTLSDRNGRKGSYIQKAVPEITQEFRIVRDNRMHQNIASDIMPGSLQNSHQENHQGTSNSQNKSSIDNLIDHKHLPGGNSDGCGVHQNLNGSCDSGPAHGKDKQSRGIDKASLPNEKQMAVSDVTGMVRREVKNKSQAHSEKIAPANPIIRVYSSASDPVRVPSSISSGDVGAIQHEVGVVGFRRRTSESDHSVTCTSGLGYSSRIPLSKRNAFSSRQTTTSFNSSHPNQLASKTIFPHMFIRKSFAASQYDGQLHQQVKRCLKAKYPNMEWKPKSSQKHNADGAPAATQSNQMQAYALSDKLLQVSIPKSEHVIIPHHLQVPESERAGLIFGSFGTMSSLKASNDTEKSSNGPSRRSTSSPVGFVEDPVGGNSVLVDCQVRTYCCDNSVSAAEPEVLLPVNNESLSPRDIGTYPDIGPIQSHAASCMLHEKPQSLKNLPSLVDYLAYDSQVTFDIPFSKTIMEDNTQNQGLLSMHEDSSTHVANSGSFSSMSMVQQQQPFTQLYPQVHISHYPNFMPYQQIFSPPYVPQSFVPNYLNNSAHIHPSSGSNYLMVTGGSPHATSNSTKYGASQFKLVQAGNSTTGYGSYTNPGGYMVGAGMEELARINFKDNNVYVPNPQSDADIWLQPPRDLAGLQPSQCYNLAGEARPHPTYLPAGHAANLALNPATFPSAHLKYPGFYQPLQPGSVTGQQVLSGLAANSGIGIVPAATPHVGAYQQTQLGNLGWPGNF